MIGPLIACLAAGAVLTALARRFLDVVEVRGTSMAPALVPGDRLLVARRLGPLRPGDIVLAPDPRTPDRELVKRVAAVAATGVTLRGDNADWSTDARVFGTVAADAIRWRVVWRYWSARRR